MHVGVCPEIVLDKLAAKTVSPELTEKLMADRRGFGTSFVKLTSDGNATRLSPEEVFINPKDRSRPAEPLEVQLSGIAPYLDQAVMKRFDKKAYQREYMRKRRADRLKVKKP